MADPRPVPSPPTALPDRPSTLRFGRFELQVDEHRLLVDGQPAPLRARTLELLIALAQRAGSLVTRQELLDLVWPGLVVEENNLSVQINALRKVLGSEIVATVPGRGYRFTVPIDSTALRAPTPLSLASKLKTNLPGLLAPLIGRADDLLALAALVDRQPLVTLLGAGGIGKTRLAQALLHQRLAHYSHGVCFIDLATLAPVDAVLGTVAAALGLPQPGGSTPLATLVNALAPLDLLIALDNAEQVVDGVAELAAALLTSAARVRLLVTSQAPLKTAQESLYRLEPLALPPVDAEASAEDGAGGHAGARPDAAAALGFGAVALFAQRAQALDRHFVVTDANVAQVITLCRLLDGAPLAIELAAARLPQLGLAALTNALHQRLHLLTGGRRDAPQRQQTLRATLAWSHGLLSPAEQTVFRRLSVFVGSASLAGAQQVLADEAPGELDAWAVLDALGALVDRSLVDLVEGPGGPDDLPRYRLLVSAGLYASEQLLAAGEGEALARRHAQALQAMLVQARDDLHSGRVLFGTWQQALDPDVGNGLAAVACALRCSDLAGVLAMTPALSRQMSSRRQHECRALWNTVAPLLLAAPSEPPLPPMLVARAALEGGRFYNNSERGLTLTGLAHSLAIRLGDDETRYLALESMAFVAGARDERDAYREAMAERQRLHDPRWSNYVLAEGGSASLWAFIQADDLDGAQADIQRHAVLIQAAGMNDEIEQSNRVCLLSEAGRIDEAIELAEAMYARTAGQRNRDDQRGTLFCLTGDYLTKGWTAKARVCAADFWPMAKRFTMQAEWADCAAHLAALEQRPQDAMQLLGYAEASNATQGKPRQPQEQRHAEKVERLALAAWGASADPQAVARLKARGRLMQDADLFALGLPAAMLTA